MTLTIDDKIGEQLKRHAAQYGREPNAYLAELLDQVSSQGNSSPIDTVYSVTRADWPSGLQPGFIADPQERLAAYLASRWPGDETEEEMQAMADWVDD